MFVSQQDGNPGITRARARVDSSKLDLSPLVFFMQDRIAMSCVKHKHGGDYLIRHWVLGLGGGFR